MSEETGNQAKLEAQKAAYLKFITYVKENCTENPDFARGFSLAIEAHRVLVEIRDQQELEREYSDQPTLREAKIQNRKVLEFELMTIQAQYYATRTNPKTIEGWSQGLEQAQLLDEAIHFDYTPGQPQPTLYEMAMTGTDYSAIGPSV